MKSKSVSCAICGSANQHDSPWFCRDHDLLWIDSPERKRLLIVTEQSRKASILAEFAERVRCELHVRGDGESVCKDHGVLFCSNCFGH